MSSNRSSCACGRCFRQAGIAFASLFALTAALPAPPDDFIRQGNQAFERGEFDEALRQYQQAEERGTDPGLIAFNKATCYYQLQDYRQAENHYRMALDDAAIPSSRRAKALYNLGNCLVRQADQKDVDTLRAAIRCYELCLDAEPEDGLRRDAAHNLELAKLLWNKARATLAEPPPPNDRDSPDHHRPPEPKKIEPAKKDDNGGPSQPDKEPKKQLTPKIEKDPKGEVKGKEEPKKTDQAPKPGPSRVPVIPDRDDLADLTPEGARLALLEAEKRLKKERENNRKNFAIPENSSGRDW